MIAIVFIVNKSKAQNIYNFENSRHLAPKISSMYYRANQFTEDASAFTFQTKSTLSLRVGADYIFNPEKKNTFRTGLYLDLIPFYNVIFTIQEEDLPDTFSGFLQNDEQFSENVKWFFSIPLLYELRKQMSASQFFSISAGIEVTLSAKGRYDVGVGVSNREEMQGREIFAAFGETSGFFFHPGVVISPSWYFTGEKINYQLSFSYRKNIIPIFDGEYQFGNVDVSDPVRGNFKMTGDFISLGLQAHFKKSVKRRKN